MKCRQCLPCLASQKASGHLAQINCQDSRDNQLIQVHKESPIGTGLHHPHPNKRDLFQSLEDAEQVQTATLLGDIFQSSLGSANHEMLF